MTLTRQTLDEALAFENLCLFEVDDLLLAKLGRCLLLAKMGRCLLAEQELSAAGRDKETPAAEPIQLSRYWYGIVSGHSDSDQHP